MLSSVYGFFDFSQHSGCVLCSLTILGPHILTHDNRSCPVFASLEMYTCSQNKNSTLIRYERQGRGHMARSGEKTMNNSERLNPMKKHRD